MTGQKGLFKTSVARKNLMAITGLFTAFFLIIHLAGNLVLIIPDSYFPIEFWGNVASAHDMYNAYSHFLVHFWPITVIAWILYASIAIHAIDALLLTLNNRKAAGSKYVKFNNSGSTWQSRNMGILGSILLIFIILHMAQFWLQYKVLGTREDIYELVIETFHVWWYVVIYVVSITVLGFHLSHGIDAAFRSLGVYSTRGMKFAKCFAKFFAVILSVLYAIIPILVYFNVV
ncbi:MAG: succinate dehydrogenase cytochrome b subunit [Bacteroidota bacterium]